MRSTHTVDFLPDWWDNYDDMTYLTETRKVELEGFTFEAKGTKSGMVRWNYDDTMFSGYILEGSWREMLDKDRYGWILYTRNPETKELDPTWLRAGEANTLRMAVLRLLSAVGQEKFRANTNR